MNSNEHIEVIIRLVVIFQGKILLCCNSNSSPKWHYLPGGHLEKGERMDECIRREIKEEVGAEIKSCCFLDLEENFYKNQHGDHHEINLIYKGNLNHPNPFELKSQEKNVSITWKDFSDIANLKLLPKNTHKFLINLANSG